MPLKLNLGCGWKRLPREEGWVNVDMFGEPDLVCDLEAETWPWADGSVDEVLFNHSLEHMGATTERFIWVMKELYRVCRDLADVRVVVPNPRHDDFLNDPTHVRPITPQILALFSKRNCAIWKVVGAANTPLAVYHDVDFEIVSVVQSLDPAFLPAQQEGLLDLRVIPQAVQTYEILMRAMKLPMAA